eukprot:TRINITY_DN9652_c0_g3_i1.p1 TRINITY_DN9652_c0_g3~~TRINITY_DN9652_c0_g3_i1.p1  ORF type:complete len:672 (-),score=63.44 TRINITY_DN9652_c0_g3_i1:153-2168(-)
MAKVRDVRPPRLSERSGDTDANRFTLVSDASDSLCSPRFSSEVFASVSTIGKRPQEPPEGFAQQVASAVVTAIEVQLQDMTDTLVAAIRGAYQQESGGHLTQLSSRVVAGLAPELAKAVSSAYANAERTHSHAYSSTRQPARCLTAVSRYSSASKSCSSLTSSSKSSSKYERDSRAVADDLAEVTLRSQGLMAPANTAHGPSEVSKTRRQHDFSCSFISFVLPEESQGPERCSAANAAWESDSESLRLQSSTANAIQKPNSTILPGSPAGEEPKLLCLSSDAETGHRRKVHVHTADDVLQVRVQELTEEIVNQNKEAVIDADGQERGKALPALFKLGGIVGWDRLNHHMASLLYQRSALFIILLAVIKLCYSAALVAQDHFSKNVIEVKERNVLLCDIAIALGSMMGLFSLRPWSGSAKLCDALSLLDTYSQRMGLLERWRKRVLRETIGTCIIWSLVVGSAWASFFICSDLKLRALTSGVSLTVISTVLLCLNHALQHVCGNLLMFVDAFCCMVSEEPEIDRISHDWNVLQAVLRKGASSVEGCFVWVQGTLALAVPLAIADMFVYGVCSEVVVMMVPRFALLLQALRTLFAAASLTSKCDSVPSVVNALYFGSHTDSLRQYIVTYISNSAAGFHVCHVRITMGMAIKCVYIWGVAAFALLTQFFSASHR